MNAAMRKIALRHVLNLVVGHQLTHAYDQMQLSVAIVILKAIRDEPDRLPDVFRTWASELKAAHIDPAPSSMKGGVQSEKGPK